MAVPGKEPVCRAPSPFGDGSPLPTGKVPSDVAYCRWIRSEKDQPSRWSERWKFVLFDGRVRWRWGGNKKRQGKTQRVKTGQASSVRTPLKRQDKTTEVSHDFPPCTHHSTAGTREATLTLLWPREGWPLCLPGPLTTPGHRAEGHGGCFRDSPALGQMLDTQTCLHVQNTHTHTEQRTPAITHVLPYTHSSYRDDGKGTLNPLTTHWEGRICKSEFYKLWKKCSKWWIENLLPWRAVSLSKQRTKCSREVLGKWQTCTVSAGLSFESLIGTLCCEWEMDGQEIRRTKTPRELSRSQFLFLRERQQKVSCIFLIDKGDLISLAGVTSLQLQICGIPAVIEPSLREYTNGFDS